MTTIGFGAMPLSIQGRPSEEQAKAVLHAAIDAGVNFIDTADAYCLDDSDTGHNERLIASVLRERKEPVTVATKAGVVRPRGNWLNDGRPKHIREACEASLRALGVDRIELYQFHSPDPGIPFEKSVTAFAELQREGKFLRFGLSNVNVKQIDAASKILDVTSVQNRLSAYARESLDNGVVNECGRRGIMFLAYSPVGGGQIAKKLPNHPVLERIATKHGVTPHATALAWVRSKGQHVVPIPGARTIEHAVDSARSVQVVLTQEDITAIDDAEFSRA
jgi:aryl-alcohol dehydrogenase-like predicted oxidoreductase